MRIARRDYENNVYYYVADHLGTARAMVQDPAFVPSMALPCYEADFYPFGGERVYTSNCTSSYKFSAKERDSESGLDNFGARYYSSSMGRFMIPDWVAKPAAVPYAEFGDPQSLNLYVYVRNNPRSKADLDGHCYPWCTVAAGAVAGFVAGTVAEMISEGIKGDHLNGNKILKAGASGAVTGAITGLAGPEAGLAAKLSLSVTGSVAGGATERALNGEKVLDAKQVATDAAAGLAGVVVDAKTERDIASTVVRKGVSTVADVALDAANRSSNGGKENAAQNQLPGSQNASNTNNMQATQAQPPAQEAPKEPKTCGSCSTQ